MSNEHDRNPRLNRVRLTPFRAPCQFDDFPRAMRRVSMRLRIPVSRTCDLFSIALCLITAFTWASCSGCSSSPRRGVSGMVTLDGKAVGEGRISFRPTKGTSGPGAGSTISNGEYGVVSKKGLMPGEYRVEIMAWRKTGLKVRAASGDLIDEIEHIVPARYNKNSELTAKITNDGPNRFDFTLTSK